mmetsp:Transcript_11999/g.16961  ORF Transcript_11999/g.16961 Transcript_11999/m.16961 type:complete len:114 (-) Transcript_11999:100-441(-)
MNFLYKYFHRYSYQLLAQMINLLLTENPSNEQKFKNLSHKLLPEINILSTHNSSKFIQQTDLAFIFVEKLKGLSNLFLNFGEKFVFLHHIHNIIEGNYSVSICVNQLLNKAYF